MFTLRPVVASAGNGAVVWLSGEVDLTVRNQIFQSFEQAIARMDVPHLVVDVSGVTFMDSTGLSTLAAAAEKARARGGTVSVVGASDRVMWLLRLVHLDAVITVLPEDSRLLRKVVPGARGGG